MGNGEHGRGTARGQPTASSFSHDGRSSEPMARADVPSLAFEVLEEISLTVLRHGQGPPTEPEWDGFLAALPRPSGGLEKMRVLVVTDGGRPLREQQARLNDIIGGRSIRTAVVSSSIAVSFVVSVFALVQPGIRGFPSSQLGGALDYLEIHRSDRSAAESAVRRLSRDVGVCAPAG